MTSPEPETLCAAFARTVRERPDEPALRSWGNNAISWSAYADHVAQAAAGLQNLGLEKGDTLGLFLRNRPEFHILDTAALHLGIIPFSIYATAAAAQIDHVLDNADCTVVVTEATMRPRLDRLSSTPRILTLDDPDDAAAVDLLTGHEPMVLARLASAVEPGDVATLIYTSGTTGPPKGVELTHRNLVADFLGVAAVLPHPPGGAVLSYLPTAHIADRFIAHYSPMFTGACTTTVGTLDDLPAALVDARPTIFGAVPRILEKLRDALAPAVTEPLDEAAAREVLAKAGLDRALWVCSGAAPVQPTVLQFFADLGLAVGECFGMSEIGCIGLSNPLDAPRFGTVGRPIPGVEVRIAEDGELLFAGPTVMGGYRHDPAATAAAFDADGFLRSGDLAEMDEEGYITITGRKKELIINAAGKNMSPANIERAILDAGSTVSQVCVIGDRRPYNVALLTVATDELRSDEGERPAGKVAEQIERANATLSRVEQVKRFVLVPGEWTPAGGELTLTMKLRRTEVASKYATEIEELYR
jgi:long-subunit acyl-CoA synthetase (AMP-forming)